jgi:hypothetical protein
MFVAFAEEWPLWTCVSCTVIGLAFTTVFVLVSFIALIIAFVFVHFASKGNRIDLRPRSITVSEAGVCEETSESRSEHKWSVIQRVRRTKNYMAIYIAPSRAHLIPRRAFGTVNEWQRFVEFVEAHAKRT